MLFRLLIADLKHKPVVNLILLLFITMAVVAFGSGVNNIITISSAQDDFYRKANIQDYYAIFRGNDEDGKISEIIEDFKSASTYRTEEWIGIGAGNIESATSDECNYQDAIMLCGLGSSINNYFDDDNRPVESLHKGEIIVPQKLIDNKLFSLGETITLTFGDTIMKLKVAGTCKDALLGLKAIGISRILISEEDYETLCADKIGKSAKYLLVGFDTDEPVQLSDELSNIDLTLITTLSISMLKMCNFLDYSIAGMLIVVSFCLIALFLLILNYTIRFSLSLQYREIGVMKAIGFTGRNIRLLYIVKYLALTLFGGVAGFALSIPFGKLVLASLSRMIVMEIQNPWGVNLICTIAMGGLIILFALRCLKKADKISPLEAIRSSSALDYSAKPTSLSLGKSNLKPIIFLPFNDLLHEKRHYFIQAACIFFSLLVILTVADAANTFASKKMFTLIGSRSSDIVVGPDESETIEEFKQELSNIENNFRTKSIQADVFADLQWGMWLEKTDKKINVTILQGVNTKTEDYIYIEGSAPQNKKEIALTKISADDLNAQIGDTITLYDGENSVQLIVSGYFQSVFNMGQGARVHEDLTISQNPRGSFGIQIDFNGSLSTDEITEQFEILKDRYPSRSVFTANGFIDHYIDNLTLIGLQLRTALGTLMLCVCALISFLLQMSIIDKEKGEIATMKVLGFKDGFVIVRYLLRVLIVALPAIILAELLSYPFASLTVGIPFRALGLSKVEFFINPFENYLFWPLITIAAVALVNVLTTLKIRHITSHSLGEIE